MTYNINILTLSILLLVFSSCTKTDTAKLNSINVQTVDLQNHVNRLSKIYPPRSFQNISSLNLAADYIFQEFSVSGLRITKQTYQIENKGTYTNIIGEINPNATSTIVIGAHYDVCGEFQGADDNASGVAGLIELGKLLRIHQKEIPFNIQLVAYSTEEPPFFGSNDMGSYIHAKSLFDQHKKVDLMICLEMIGFYTDKEKSQKYPSVLMKPFYPSIGNFIAVVSKFEDGDIVKEIKKIFLSKTNIPCETLSAPAFIATGIDFSDHRNYWTFGYNAVMITDTSFYRNHNYHTENDTPETLNYTKMAEVVKGTFFYILSKKPK